MQKMIEPLANGALNDASVIPWATPVLMFGDLDSTVATLGLNPSSREFKVNGVPLRGNARRLHTLESLDISSWSEADEQHHHLILDDCRSYFSNNPYDEWFRRLDKVVSRAGVSYYDPSRSACHLDLVPFATMKSWGDLARRHQSLLLEASGDALGIILRESSVGVLILNGGGVVKQFQSVIDSTLIEATVPAWTLRYRRQDRQGISYRGTVNTVCGIDLGREITVLGFNHNIQSTPGVSDEHIRSIRGWVACQLS